MRFGGGKYHSYHFIIVGLAAVIVYPDEVLNWICEHTGRVFDWRHLALLEVVAVALIIGAMALLMPVYPQLEWWHPMFAVGILGLARGILWFITVLFGFRD